MKLQAPVSAGCEIYFVSGLTVLWTKEIIGLQLHAVFKVCFQESLSDWPVLSKMAYFKFFGGL